MKSFSFHHPITRISLLILALSSLVISQSETQRDAAADSPNNIFLPLVQRGGEPAVVVNAPFMVEKSYAASAIFWFGQVTPEENYADIRIGYNQDSFWVHLEVFDRRLWYKPFPNLNEFSRYDSASLFVDTDHQPSTQLDSSVHRFDGMLNWWEPREDYQASYIGSAGGWLLDEVSFTTESAWKGNVPNDPIDDRGWIIVFEIPFESLGVSAPPNGTTWQIGISLYDRDNESGSPNEVKYWPENSQPERPTTWARLRFGLPGWTPPPNIAPGGTTIIRNKLNNVHVADAMVGGGFLCGEGLEFWTEWGQTNYAGTSQVNVQNEFDVSDWPCFSKYYIVFPINSIPANKKIISATLTLYQIGNAGGGSWGPPGKSVIQVLTTRENWQENTLTWNNAPEAVENVSRLQVDPITTAGVPRVWDVSYALDQAYEAGTDLSLVLYSADGDYNTGRYFNSSDLNDYEEEFRPTLTIIWGNP